MLKSLFSPFGTFERRPFLRFCGKLYLVQLSYMILGFHLISFVGFENVSLAELLGPLFIFVIVLVFPYLHMCAYAKRLRSLSYNRLWLIPIGAVLYFTVVLTSLLTGKINPEGLFQSINGAYVSATLTLLFQVAAMLSGYLITSLCVASLPKFKGPSTLSAV